MVQSSNTIGNMPESRGRLVVQVYTADFTKPIKDAHITIAREEDGREELVRTLTTNQDGRTPVIELPAPSKSYSLSPNEPQGFYNYNIRVDYPGYYTEEQINVPVFPGITAIQEVPMIPLPLDTYTGKKITYISEPLNSGDDNRG